jgi:hypothetical protein
VGGGSALASCTVSLFLNLILIGEYGMSLKAENSVLTLGFQIVVIIYSIFVKVKLSRDKPCRPSGV